MPEHANAAEYEAAVERDLRRNMVAFVGWELLWGLEMPFSMFATFAPAYLDALGAPKTLIGLVLSFPSLFSAAQFATTYWVPPRLRQKVYLRSITGCILPWLIYAVAATAWGRNWAAPVHYMLFTLAQAIFMCVVCASGCLYWAMMTDNVPPRRRGLLLGFRAAALGAAGLCTGWSASRVLAAWQTPQNFRVAFIIGTSIFLLSCGILLLVRDHLNPAHSESAKERRLPFWA